MTGIKSWPEYPSLSQYLLVWHGVLHHRDRNAARVSLTKAKPYANSGCSNGRGLEDPLSNHLDSLLRLDLSVLN